MTSAEETPARIAALLLGATTWSTAECSRSSGWSTRSQVSRDVGVELERRRERVQRQPVVGELGDAGLLDVAADRRERRRDPAQHRQGEQAAVPDVHGGVHEHEAGDLAAVLLGEPQGERAAHGEPGDEHGRAPAPAAR